MDVLLGEGKAPNVDKLVLEKEWVRMPGTAMGGEVAMCVDCERGERLTGEGKAGETKEMSNRAFRWSHNVG